MASGSRARAGQRKRARRSNPAPTPASARFTPGLQSLWAGGPEAAAFMRQSSEGHTEWLMDLHHSAGNAAVQRALAVWREVDLQREPATADAPTLRVGSRGPEVSQLQTLLNAAGAQPVLKPDGVFGSLTRTAVIAFQGANGLQPDGVIGPKTRSALQNPAASSTKSGATTAPSNNIKPGQTPIGSGPITFMIGGEQSPEREGEDFFLRGESQFNEGDAAGALPMFERVYSLPQQPDRRRAFTTVFLAECHHKLGHTKEALAFYQEALVSPVRTSEPQVVRMSLEGIRELRMGEKLGPLAFDATPQEIDAANAKATAEIAAADAAGNSGDLNGALQHATTAYAQRAAKPSLRARAAFRMGIVHQRQLKFGEAIDQYQEILSFPDDAFDNNLSRDQVHEKIRQARIGQPRKDPPGQPVPSMTDAEQQALFAQAVGKASNGDPRGALEDFKKLYALRDITPERRAILLFNMARAHQELQEFEEAISKFEEVLTFSDFPENRKTQARNRIQQCRLKQVGALVQAGQGSDQFAFEADVLFETGSATDVGEPAGDTLNDLAVALEARHRSVPGRQFMITFVGHASNRFRSAKTSEEADRRNRELSAKRAETAHQRLFALLDASEVRATIFQAKLDPQGDSESQKLGLDREDNSWVFRRVRIVVTQI